MIAPTLNAEGQTQLPRPHPAVVYKPIADGAVLLQTETEVYFGLNAVGREIWSLLPPESMSLRDLCGKLREAYPESEPERVHADVSDLLARLVDQKLVVSE